MKFMMWKSMSVARKIWISMSLLLLGYTLTVGYGFLSDRNIGKRVKTMSEYLIPASNNSRKLLMEFAQQIRFYNDAAISKDQIYIQAAEGQAKNVQRTIKKMINLKGLSSKIKTKLKYLEVEIEKYTVDARSVLTEINETAVDEGEGETESYIALKGRAKSLTNNANLLRNELEKLTGAWDRDLHYELSLVSRLTKSRRWINLITFLVVIVFASFGTAAMLRKSVITPLKDTVHMIETIAEGDLTKKYEVKMDDEIGQIVTALNVMVRNFQDIVHMVSEITMKANSSASEMSVAVDEQAAVSSQQSASMSQITSTMEELTASSTQIAGHADSVAEIAMNALQSTKGGAEAVNIVMSMMEEINRDNREKIDQIIQLGEKSEEINKVMEIIGNVADQTKLIAFNAALEASSAGEAGKRFGVVAVEIRRLADSVMESTGETETKINEIQKAFSSMVISSEKGSKGMKEGLEYSTQASAKIAEIVEGAQSTADAAKQISLSTQQAKTSSEQVVTALKEIVQGSKQTTESMKQISVISKDLTEVSSNLKNLVNKFKIEESSKRAD